MLKDLGVTSIDEINEEDSELLDAQIQSLLDEDNENLGGIEDSLMKLAEFNESAIDDDDDEEEGNENSQADLDRLEKTMEHDAIDDEIKAIDSNLTLLDDEISKLTPLINDTNQGLLEEKETKRNNWKKKTKETITTITTQEFIGEISSSISTTYGQTSIDTTTSFIFNI